MISHRGLYNPYNQANTKSRTASFRFQVISILLVSCTKRRVLFILEHIKTTWAKMPNLFRLTHHYHKSSWQCSLLQATVPPRLFDKYGVKNKMITIWTLRIMAFSKIITFSKDFVQFTYPSPLLRHHSLN
jgi:hypothetical protein